MKRPGQRIAAALLAIPAGAVSAGAGENAIELSRAWTPAVAQPHVDSPLYLTIANRADAPDSLVRVRCPSDLADFVEKHATDRGEGGVAMREVKAFAIQPGGTMTLAPGGNHLMLLNVRQPLQEGQGFTCSLVFQKAGTVPVDVKVAPADTKEAP